MPPDPTPITEPITEPQSIEDFLRRGWIYHVKGDHAHADADFRQALSMDPNSVEANYGLGMSLKIQGRGEEGRQVFEKTIALINEGKMKDDSSRATMLRHLSTWHIETIQSGQYKGEPAP